MTWPWTKYRELASQYEAELAEINRELQDERSRRIMAEALAAERLREMGKAYEAADRSERSRDEAIHARITSLDLVNTSLLKTMEPEKQRDIKDFKSVPRQEVRLSGIALRRKLDHDSKMAMYRAPKKKQEEQVQ